MEALSELINENNLIDFNEYKKNIKENSNVIKDFVEDAAPYIDTGASITVSPTRNVQRLRINKNTIVTLPSGMPGIQDSIKSIILIFKQDEVGKRTMRLAVPVGEKILFNNSMKQPPIAIAPNKITIYVCTKPDGDTNWYVSQSFIQA
jgi:hypothetical protein